jgi:hypothetical protein
MGQKKERAERSDLEERVSLLEDALHRTRQRADLLANAVEDLVHMQAGRGLERADLIDSLSLHGWFGAACAACMPAMLEPDHLEAIEPIVRPRERLSEAPSRPSPLAAKARLAGARYAFSGQDPLADLRRETV